MINDTCSPKKAPFHRYTQRCGFVDIAEVLRAISSYGSVQKGEAGILTKNGKPTIFCKNEDIIRNISETYMLYNRTSFITVGKSSKIKIVFDVPKSSCPPVKRPDAIKKVSNGLIEVDTDPRAAPLVGALRWGLEKYVLAQFLHFSTNDADTMFQLIGMWLCDRGVKVRQADSRECRFNDKDYDDLVARFTRYYPPYLVFGRGSSSLERISYGPSVRVVKVSCCDIELEISPPPVVYKAFLDLGLPPNKVEEAVASLLAAATSMLNPQEAFCGEAPVPLTAQIEDSWRQCVEMGSPYSVSKELADYVIKAAWERISEKFKK
jgi:hypothetical protein